MIVSWYKARRGANEWRPPSRWIIGNIGRANRGARKNGAPPPGSLGPEEEGEVVLVQALHGLGAVVDGAVEDELLLLLLLHHALLDGPLGGEPHGRDGLGLPC